MYTIKKFILLVACTIVLTTICYANYGSTKWGGEQYGVGKWGTTSQDLSGTYWTTAMTDRWTDVMTVDSLWTTAMNTEIP